MAKSVVSTYPNACTNVLTMQQVGRYKLKWGMRYVKHSQPDGSPGDSKYLMA